MPTTMADLCKTDLKLVIKYLSDAASLYESLPGLRCSSRAWVIRRLIRKLNVKLQNQLNHDKK